MKKTVLSLLVTAAVITTVIAAGCEKSPQEKRKERIMKLKQITDTVRFSTSEGDIVIGLYGNAMPQTVSNFLGYVRDGFYADTVFHRVIPGFVIQGGGFTPDMDQKKTKPPLKLETSPVVGPEDGSDGEKNLLLKHGPYMLSMARKRPPHTATSQFFITLDTVPHLDPKKPWDVPDGYAVFGTVLEGRKTVDAIAAKKTATVKGHRDVPVKLPVVTTAEIVKENGAEK